MTAGPADERPLSEDERRALLGIEAHVRDSDPEFPQRLGSAPGLRHPALRQIGRRPRGWEIAAVTVLTSLYVAVLLLVPEHMVLETVVLTQVVIVPACCVLWAVRRGRV
ncbi:DUF3040 domain-containing protein [Pseudonocardia sp. KRD291]|uniref:DUF3040 domain-containing protein n=1 Tax=Pseudonocardia sp. KRD291 TaxID=2792007 RepID=UPI001C4A08C5|nr:DUF3040 domain-containing protein [Pseudonocardia sp. KRD291]MBW0102869.1 DUF3040 domain-containing protein [Pseudonocardia sp. KRD291]